MFRQSPHIPSTRAGRKRLVCLLAVLLLATGCAGGLPSIPNSPDDILAAADAYYKRKKYFQAQELYRAFLQRHPGEDRSDYAQFMLGESYFADEEYGLAAVEYRVLVSNYGYSDYVDDGYFKEALSLYEQSPKSHLDQTKAYDALEKLQRFVQVFPTSPLLPQAEEYTGKIRGKLACKDLDNALFYYRRARFGSAVIYLDKIIDNYPSNACWVEAHYYRGMVALDRGEVEKAIRLFSHVVNYPEDLEIKKLAGEALQRLNQSRP